MTLASPSRSTPLSTTSGVVRTVLADRTRAVVQVTRELDSAGVAMLERLLDEHYAAGRRFLRISVVGVRGLSASLITLLERTHYRMLARRGTGSWNELLTASPRAAGTRGGGRRARGGAELPIASLPSRSGLAARQAVRW